MECDPLVLFQILHNIGESVPSFFTEGSAVWVGQVLGRRQHPLDEVLPLLLWYGFLLLNIYFHGKHKAEDLFMLVEQPATDDPEYSLGEVQGQHWCALALHKRVLDDLLEQVSKVIQTKLIHGVDERQHANHEK